MKRNPSLNIFKGTCVLVTMSQTSTIQHLFLSLLALFIAFAPHASAAAVPATLTTISTPVAPQLNISLGTDPPLKVRQIDSIHSIYFTRYQHLVPERNYFAAIIAMQTALMTEYFERRAETLLVGAVSLDVFNAQVLVDNPIGVLTYAMAHRMMGELGEFLMEGNFCMARFELWEVRAVRVKQLSVGWLIPEYIARTVA